MITVPQESFRLSAALNSLSPLGGKWAWSRAAPSVPGLWIKTENSDMGCRSQQRGLCVPKGQSLLMSLQLTERRWIAAFSCNSFMRFSWVGKVVPMQGSQSKISAGKLVTMLNRRSAERDEDGQAELDSTHRVLKEAASAQIQPVVTQWEVGLLAPIPLIFLEQSEPGFYIIHLSSIKAHSCY